MIGLRKIAAGLLDKPYIRSMNINHAKSTAIILALSLGLSACGTSTDPVQPPVNTQPSNPTKEMVSVTLVVDFPKEETEGIGVLGSPISANKAVITIYEGTTLLGTQEIVKSGSTSSVSVQLPIGRTVRFDVSVKNASGTEVAWGSMEYKPTASAKVELPIKSIIGSAALTTERQLPQGRELALKVNAIDSSNMPLGDYEVNYSITGGKILSESKLGVVIDVTEPTATITATVSGLSSAHRTINYTSTRFLIKDLGAPLTLNGTTIVNQSNSFPSGTPTTGVSFPLEIVGQTRGGKPISGTIQPDRSFTVTLPSVTDELVLSPYPGLSDGTKGVMIPIKDIYPAYNGTRIGSFTSPLNLQLRGGTTTDLIGLIYVDQDTSYTRYIDNRFCTIGGGCVGSPTLTTSEVKRGWNVVYSQSPWLNSPSTYMAPLVGEDGQLGYFNYLTLNIVDAGVTQQADTVTPLEGYDVNHTVAITGAAGPVILSIPKGLLLNGGFTGASCEAAVSTSTSNDYTCRPNVINGAMNITFKTTAQPLDHFPENPSHLVVRLGKGGFIDLNSANDTSSLAFTRQPGVKASVSPSTDLQAPLVSIDSPSNPTLNAILKITGTASDNNTVQKVEFYDGVILLGQATLSGSIWHFNWTPTSSGVHELKAVAYDSSGNTGMSQISVTVK